MPSEVQQVRPPTRSKRDQDVLIEHLPNGGVVVRKDFPDDQRRKGLKAVIIICLILCLIPLVVWMLFGRIMGGQFAAAGSGLFVVSIVPNLARQFAANTRACVLRADQTGLTIDLTTWRGATTRHFNRGQIDDIVLDCSGGSDPHHTVFKSFLVIKPSEERTIRCLHDVGGDVLARVANELRAALRMPPRTWP